MHSFRCTLEGRKGGDGRRQLICNNGGGEDADSTSGQRRELRMASTSDWRCLQGASPVMMLGCASIAAQARQLQMSRPRIETRPL